MQITIKARASCSLKGRKHLCCLVLLGRTTILLQEPGGPYIVKNIREHLIRARGDAFYSKKYRIRASIPSICDRRFPIPAKSRSETHAFTNFL